MSDTLAEFPYFELQFGADGAAGPGATALLDDLPRSGAKDLFVICHGWNNAPHVARRLYERFLGEMAKLLAKRDTVATAGVIWPSMRWPDEGDPEAGPDSGGAAAMPGAAMTDRELVVSLKEVFAGREGLLDELADLLEARPADRAELRRFQELVGQLASAPDDPQAKEDNQEQSLLTGPAERVFALSARQARVRGPHAAAGLDGGGAAIVDVGGAASLNLDRLWDGAKQVLRQTTYWEMKKRAGRVGSVGLGPLLVKLHARAPELRVHLVGHSFGSRVISFALEGLGDVAPADSPVKSAVLVQGAFSHYAFAASLPHEPGRAGALAGMQRRVDGPLVVTHSKHDLAVGRLYPAASLASGEDAAAMADWMARWAAIGHDGAQAVGARSAPLGAVGTTYELHDGEFLNLDGNDVISHGRPPSGAHSDIFHPQLAWAVLCAAGLAPS